MPPRSISSLAREKTSAESVRMLRSLGISRTSVQCRHCRARLLYNARAIRDHLQICVSAGLVILANSERFLRNSRAATAATAALAVATTAGAAGAAANSSATSSPADKSSSGKRTTTTEGNSSSSSGGSSRGKSTTTTATVRRMAAARATDVQEPPKELLKPLQLPQRILTGPGPSNCSQRVLRALHQQVLGHMHPETFQLMDEIKAGLRYAFQTSNKLTLAISASGHGGMEAAIGNLLERGENILIVKAGVWGERAADMAARLGIHVDFLETKLGVAFTLDELEAAVKLHKPNAVFVAHSESSTGLKQPLEGVGEVVHKYGGLLIVDTVASLGAEPFFADAWAVDVVYTGSQKVLGAPAGITPISFSPLAEKKILSRKTKVPVFYWDMTLLGRYWNCFGEKNGPRIYHHTICSSLVYALREALAQLAEEGLTACWARHAAVTERFHEGLIRRGYDFFVKEPQHRLRTVSAILLPQGVDATLVIRYAMEKYNLEISGGLGPTVGKIIRVGLMGVNATSGHVDLVLRALDEATKHAKNMSKM